MRRAVLARPSSPLSPVKGVGSRPLSGESGPPGHHVRANAGASVRRAVSDRFDAESSARRARSRGSIRWVKPPGATRPAPTHNTCRSSLSRSRDAEWTRSAGACVTPFISHSDSGSGFRMRCFGSETGGSHGASRWILPQRPGPAGSRDHGASEPARGHLRAGQPVARLRGP